MSEPLEDRCSWILDRIREFAGEHCDGYVFIANVKDPESDDTRTPMSWSGGFNQALGMANRAHERLKLSAAEADKPEQPPEDGDEWKEKV